MISLIVLVRMEDEQEILLLRSNLLLKISDLGEYLLLEINFIWKVVS